MNLFFGRGTSDHRPVPVPGATHFVWLEDKLTLLMSLSQTKRPPLPSPGADHQHRGHKKAFDVIPKALIQTLKNYINSKIFLYDCLYLR
jgi:hypothetical protein